MSTQYVFITRPGPRVGTCAKCGRDDDDIALGFCFDCASKGEERASKRKVRQHLFQAFLKLFQPRRWRLIRYDLSWAWERLTGTGDYAQGGTFDKEGYDWRAR